MSTTSYADGSYYPNQENWTGLKPYQSSMLSLLKDVVGLNLNEAQKADSRIMSGENFIHVFTSKEKYRLSAVIKFWADRFEDFDFSVKGLELTISNK